MTHICAFMFLSPPKKKKKKKRHQHLHLTINGRIFPQMATTVYNNMETAIRCLKADLFFSSSPYQRIYTTTTGHTVHSHRDSVDKQTYFTPTSIHLHWDKKQTFVQKQTWLFIYQLTYNNTDKRLHCYSRHGYTGAVVTWKHSGWVAVPYNQWKRWSMVRVPWKEQPWHSLPNSPHSGSSQHGNPCPWTPLEPSPPYPTTCKA